MHIVNVPEEVNIGITEEWRKFWKKCLYLNIVSHCITCIIDKLIIRNFFTFFLSFYFLIWIRIGYVIIFSSNLFIWRMRNVKIDDKYIKKKKNRKINFIGIHFQGGSRRFQDGKKPPTPHLSFSHATVGVIGTYCSSCTAGSRIDRESGPRGIPRSWRSSLCPSTPRTWIRSGRTFA